MSNTAELIFNKYGKMMLKASEVAELLSLELGSFQTMLSSEEISIPRKERCRTFHFRDVANFIDSRQVTEHLGGQQR